MLYDRDFTKLTPREQAEKNRHDSERAARKRRDGFTVDKYPRLSKAVQFHNRLFPNYFLDPSELRLKKQIASKTAAFAKLLDRSTTTEQELLTHIRESRSWFIIASIMQEYFTFGHHEAYLFPELTLGSMHRVDYLLVGKSSGGYEFIFVELESPNGPVTLKDGEFGKAIRNGTAQTTDWDAWLGGHFASLSDEFAKRKGLGRDLPSEFVRYERSRTHFVVVAGRRRDYKDKTYHLRRREKKSDGSLILHYDNLIECAAGSAGRITY